MPSPVNDEHGPHRRARQGLGGGNARRIDGEGVGANPI
jgi:hypothetical protein